jgi:tRNA A37 threonylcarbamoyladenosine synthetase subunit TsaC/SUA5/YrdC
VSLKPCDDRFLSEAVFLTATDTTTGFVSQNAEKLDAIKGRPAHKRYIRAVDSLETLKKAVRVPQIHKKAIRRARKRTFVFPSGDSFRVVYDAHHLLLLRRLKWAYTTSANRSGEKYDEAFAQKSADIIVAPLRRGGTP